MRARLPSLTGLRFLAALLVVLNHSVVELTRLPLLGRLVGPGYVGVTFFFVLSGFVLTWAATPGDSPRAFYRRRFARVYPLHLATLLVAIPICAWTGWAHSWGAAFVSVLLLQAWSTSTNVAFSFNSPSWSLSCEAFFYAVFPWLHARLARIERWLALGVAVYAAMVAAALAVVVLAPARLVLPLLYLNPVYRLGEFAIGILLGLAVQRGWRPRLSAHAAGALSLVVFLGVGTVGGVAHHYGRSPFSDRHVADLVMLPVFVLLIGAAAGSDLEGGGSAFRRPWMVRLGEWSFALYLTHWLLMRVLIKLGTPSSLPLRAVEELLFLVGAVAVSAVAYYGLERPLERRLRKARPRVEEPLERA